MKIPLSWLSEYVEIKNLSDKEISEGLRFSGTENFLEQATSFEKIVVGKIVKINKHPDADKLKVATVEITKNNKDNLQIVCGASNIKAGQKVPVALLGARLGELEIQKVVIRGVASSGMLCSEKELGLGEDHSGILILKDEAKIGASFVDYLGKNTEKSNSSTSLERGVIDAEITPNRGDCLSLIGIAQEVSSVFKKKLSLPKFRKMDISSQKRVDVEVLEKDLSPRYIAKVVEAIKVRPSPTWLRNRLLSAGVRPISNVVDVTNYVMLELGQPLHAFDFDKVLGKKTSGKKVQNPKIVARRAKKDEKIITLDGVKRDLSLDDLVIADAKKPIAIAGVMGGRSTEVDENTKNIIFEAAVFDSESVRKTAKRLSNRTEASNRFEKGVPLNLPEIAIERATELLLEISEKQNTKKLKVGANTDILSAWIWIQRIGLDFFRIKKLLGVDIKEKEVFDILTRIGFFVEKFDFKKEARKHTGKPYVFGAKFKTHGEMAFDCSYLTDYIYSQIGQFIGYTSLAQYEIGTPVRDEDLIPGDVLFLKGHIDKSVTDHYFVPCGNNKYRKVLLDTPKEVGHNALYIGNGRIIHARSYQYSSGKWKKLPPKNAVVVEEDVSVFLDNPEYLGARRYVKNPNSYIKIIAPWWRLDVKTEEDVLEELVRIYGYEKMPQTLPSGQIPIPSRNYFLELSSDFKKSLTKRGYSELISYSFVPKSYIAGSEKKDVLKILNPISSEQSYMRTSLIPSFLEAVAKNQENFEQIKIFEIAKTYTKDSEKEKLAILAKLNTKDIDSLFLELKGVVEVLIGSTIKKEILLKKGGEGSFFEEGQSAKIMLEKKEIGVIGIISRENLEKFGIKGKVAVTEISFDDLLLHFPPKVMYTPPSRYPHSIRDVNLLFKKEVTALEIIDLLKKDKPRFLLDFRILDIYRGTKSSKEKTLSADKKSVTIRLVIGSTERTLVEEEIKNTEYLILKKLSLLGAEARF